MKAAQGATRAKSYGRDNAYVCDRCRGVIFTRDMEEGVTPFMLPCLADVACIGLMASKMYRVPAGVVPHYQWRKPTAEEYARMTVSSRRHIDQGGLEIYAATMLDPATVRPRPFKP